MNSSNPQVSRERSEESLLKIQTVRGWWMESGFRSKGLLSAAMSEALGGSLTFLTACLGKAGLLAFS